MSLPAGSQSPARTEPDALIGKSSSTQTGEVKQHTDAQQRPGVSGVDAPKTAGADASGISQEAISNAEKSASGFTSQAARKEIETRSVPE